MRRLRSFVRASVWAAAAVPLVAGTAFAQSPSPTGSAKGFCSPWHRCMGAGLLAVVVLYLGFAGLMWLIQRRGFESIEHRQGAPEGAPVEKR